MKKLDLAVFVGSALALGPVVGAGVITSIQRLDDDQTPNFNEALVPGGLKQGALIWTDRTFTYGTLPTAFQNLDYVEMVTTDHTDPNYQLSMSLNAPSTVYLFVDDRVSTLTPIMPWVTALGFTDTGANLLVADHTTSIYTANFASGSVLFRQQADANGANMYTIAAAPQANQGDLTLFGPATVGNVTYNTITFQATDQNIPLTQNAGTTLTIDQGAITKNGTFNSSIAGGILGTPSGAFNFTVNAGILTVASALNGTANKLILNGGGTLELTSTDAANNFQGGIFLNGGTLLASDARNLGGSSAGANTINFNGGALQTAGRLDLSANTINIGQGGGTLRAGVVGAAAGAINLGGNNQLQGTGTLFTNGPGTVIIAGANAFTAPVFVASGVLELRNPGALGGNSSTNTRSPITLSNGSTLNLHSDFASLDFGNAISVVGAGQIDVGRLNLTGGGAFLLSTLNAVANPNGIPPTLTITNSKNDGSTLDWTGPITLGNNTTINALDGADVGFDGQVSGQFGLSKSGPGALSLEGAQNNFYTGPTTVTGGILALAKTGNAVSVPTDLTINGGLVRMDTDNQIADFANISLLTGALSINGRTDVVSAMTISGGSLTTGAGKLVLNNAVSGPLPGSALVGSGSRTDPLPASPVAALIVSGGSTTINAGGEINAISMQVSGGINTVQAGGLLTVGSGGLTFAGSLSPNITFLADGVNPGRMSLSGNVSFTGLAGTASLDTSGPGALPGKIDFNGAERTFTINDGADAIDTRVSASITNGALRKSGAGTLRLTGANTYAGGSTITAGALEVTSPAALGTGPVTLNGGQLNIRTDALPAFTSALNFTGDATLNVDRDTPAGGSSGTVQFLGGLTIGASQFTVAGANRSLQFTAPTTLTGNAKINATSIDVRFSGSILQSGGPFTLTKDGGGKVTFDGGAAPNTYTGATRVNGGTLELNKPAGAIAIPANLDVFGGTVRLLASDQIADTAAVSVQNAGTTLDLNGNNETIASLNGTSGQVSLGSGGILTVTQGTYNGVVAGAGRVIQDNPAGGTTAVLNLNGVNTFSGGVAVNHGTVSFGAQAPGHVGTTLNVGDWGVYNGSALNFAAGSNILTNKAFVTLSGAGSAFPKFDSLADNQGTLQIIGGKAFTAAGAMNNSGVLTVGAGSAFTANGGLTNVGSFTDRGSFTAAGNVTTSGTMTLYGTQQYAPATTLHVTGGTAIFNSDAGSAGAGNQRLAIDATGGSLQLNTTQHVTNVALSSVGSVVLGSTLTPAPLPAGSPPSAGPSVLVTSGFSAAGTAKLDLQNNALIVDYSGLAGPATFNAVQNAVRSGYNAAGTLWTGSGINSSVARDNSTAYGIGYAQSSAVLGAGGGVFRGETVDGTAIVARFTLLGDATLDGVVDFNDLVKLAQSYNTAGTTWNSGDFTYDGVTDFNDLVKLAQSYNTGILGAPPIPGASASFEQDLARAAALVPEPSMFAVMGMAAAATGLGRRRRRDA